MRYILIAVLILISTLQSLFCRFYSGCYPGEESMASPVFSVTSGLTVAAAALAVSGFSFAPSWQTVLLGCANAAVLIGYNTCMVRASQTGPYSVQMTFMLSGGILVPAVVSLGFGDRFSWIKWCAIAMIVVSIWLVSRKSGEGKITSRIFLPLCAGLFLANGAYGALFDIQQRLTGEGEKEAMVAVTYAVTAVASFAAAFARRRTRLWGDFRQTKKSCLFLVLSSLVVAVAINLMVFILPLVDTTLLYTFDNAGVLLLSVLSSCLWFHERLSVRNIAGCTLMCAGLVMMSVG